jgi:hypothetical protein
MAIPWYRAKSIIDSISDYPKFVKQTELANHAPEDGDFMVSLYETVDNRTFLGMSMLPPIAEDRDHKKCFDRKTFDKVKGIAEKNRLTLNTKENIADKNITLGCDIVLYQAGIPVAMLGTNRLYSADAELFEELGEEIYGLKLKYEKFTLGNMPFLR